jgi:hypothetical protein
MNYINLIFNHPGIARLNHTWSRNISLNICCYFEQVYHAHSDSYETQNQHYGRSLTKETIKDGKCEKNQWFYLLQLTK